MYLEERFGAARIRDRAYAVLAAGLVGYGLGASSEEVLSQSRGNSTAAFARQTAMYLCHVVFELSLARVAIAFGRDRSTVAHACHCIEDRREDGEFDAWIESLETALRAVPAQASFGGDTQNEVRI